MFNDKFKRDRLILNIKDKCPNLSNRKIAKLANCSHQTVARVLKRAAKCGLNHLLAEQCSDTELCQLLYPLVEAKEGSYRPPEYESALKESMKKKGKGKSQIVQYLEYQKEDPSTAYSRAQYFHLIRKFLKKCRIAMRQQHRAGEVVYIDYSGTGVCYEKNGKKVWLKVFVGCLGASKKLFAFATPGERTIDWINGMINMFDYFGGVTEIISIDNASALVTKPGIIPILVKNILMFGEHYNSIVDSCRVGMPQDKSLVELGVKFIKQRILIPMNNDMTLGSAEEVNRVLMQMVEELNSQPFQKFKVSRNQLFDEIEKPELSPLPKHKFNLVLDFKILKVPADYHIFYDEHYYSVPHKLAHEQVEVIVNQTHIKIVFEHQVQALHLLSNDKGGCTTDPAHLSPAHRAESLKTKDQFMDWAKAVGGVVPEYIDKQYADSKNPASRAIGKRCQSLMRLCDSKGESAFKRACDYALTNQISASELGLVISALDIINVEDTPAHIPAHTNIRGKGYYGGRHEH